VNEAPHRSDPDRAWHRKEIPGPQGATVRQIGLADSRLALLGRAIRWIRSHYDETLRVEELAELATPAPHSSRPEMAPTYPHGHAVHGHVGNPAPSR
jgi:hypothetical protein